MDSAPEWQTLAGTFLHRAVLHPGGKWCPVHTADDRDQYLDHSLRLARQLHHALRDENYYLAEALGDKGGPSWSQSIDQYRMLSTEEMMQAITPLLTATEPIVRSILTKARRDRWRQVHTEVGDPFSPLKGQDDGQDNKRVNTRIDLLADRGRRPPLVVELKTTSRTEEQPPPTARKKAEKDTQAYAQTVANACHRDVNYRWVWARMTDGKCTWGDKQSTQPTTRPDHTPPTN